MSNRTKLAATVALLMGMGACSYANTEPTEFACAYGGGPFESKTAKGDVPIYPSSGRDFIGVADTIIYLPADVRNYIVDKDPGTGDVPSVDSISAPSDDGVDMVYEVNVRFRLNQDLGCEFWEEHGKRFSIDSTEGWQDFLAQNLRPVLDNAVKSETQRYEWEDIWRNVATDDGATWDIIQDNVGAAIVAEVNRSLGGDYLCGVTWSAGAESCPPFEVLIKSAVPADSSLTQRYAQIQAEQAETERALEELNREQQQVERQAEIDLAEATAQLEVSQVEADKAAIDAQATSAECARLAEIGIDCVMLEAARNGSIEFWVTDEAPSVVVGQ